ncbi:MAG: hypothetical protein ACK4SY_03160 [Pyrobaculum sp.]
MKEIIDGIASAPSVVLLTEVEEVRPSPRLKPLYDFLADLGLLQRKGDKYVKTQVPPRQKSALSEAVAKLFQEVVLPYITTGERVSHLPHDLQWALYIYVSSFQTMRIVITQEVLGYGGLTLVAGWFPCGFSSELISIAGRDIVVVEEREDVVALEMDRLSLIPYTPAPLGQELAAASFYAFETTSLRDVSWLAEKYGTFDTAVVCNRGVDLRELAKIAKEIYYIAPLHKSLGYLNDVLLGGLGLSRPTEDLKKELTKVNAREIEGFMVYFITTR